MNQCRNNNVLESSIVKKIVNLARQSADVERNNFDNITVENKSIINCYF